MPQPSDKTNRKVALTGGGTKSVSKNVHHLRPIGMPTTSTDAEPTPAAGSEVVASAGDSEHKRPVTIIGPLPVRRWRGATALAYEANGYKEFKVCAPRSIEAATHTIPHPTEKDETIVIALGPDSVEYAPFHAVPGEVVRILFDPARIGAETRRMNEEAEMGMQITAKNNAKIASDLLELNAETDAKNAALESKKRDKQAENKPRRDMGDFADDEDGQCYLHRRKLRIAGGERVAGADDDDI